MPNGSAHVMAEVSNADKTIKLSRLKYWLLLAANLTAGAITPLSLAPYDFWPAAILGLMIFFASLAFFPRRYFWQALMFGLGLFGTGASWVYVSIHDFGQTSPPLAMVLTGIFVVGLAIVFALPYTLFKYFSHRHCLLTLLASAPTFWLLGEWLRGWLLTGFPWLYVGYGHLTTPLAGYAPIGGVLLVSLAVALSCSGLIVALYHVQKQRWTGAATAMAGVALIWLAGGLLKTQTWTQTSGEPIQVGLVQPNIAQEDKWVRTKRIPTLRLFQTMSDDLWPKADWVVWPEAALPMLYEDAIPFINNMHRTATTNNAALITGVLYRSTETNKIYNTIIARGLGQGIYHKTRLVPFGEYVPLESWLRGTLAFFDLPTSIIAKGQPEQRGLQVGEHLISANICYEVVYPSLIAQSAHDSHVLLTISNDAWFGDSIGPLQHMQMAQMRALETGRDLIRGTNNGISALVNHRGTITAQLPQFTQDTLVAPIQPRTGATPFMQWQHRPIEFLLALALILLAVAPKIIKRRQ